MNYIKSLRSVIGTRPIIAPGSAIIVMNKENELLLQLRSDTKDWGIPGGGMELGDSFEETAKKELYEETGLIANQLELLDVASGKEFYYKFPHGDEIYNATVIYKATEITGELKKDEESLELCYFPLEALPKLNYTTLKILEKIGYLTSEDLDGIHK
jgi:8-oxo-dGTP pyrophosphatase MutT (NUDIX family)